MKTCQADVDNLVEQYEALKLTSVHQVMDLMDVSRATAYRVLEKYCPGWKRLFKEQRQNIVNWGIVEHVAQQVVPDLKEAATQFGCSVKKVRELVKRWQPEVLRKPAPLTVSEIIVAAFDSRVPKSVQHIAEGAKCSRGTVYGVLDHYRPNWRRGWPERRTGKSTWPGFDAMRSRLFRSRQAHSILQQFVAWDFSDPCQSHEFWLADFGYVRLNPEREDHWQFLIDQIAGEPPKPAVVRAIMPRKLRRRKRWRKV